MQKGRGLSQGPKWRSSYVIDLRICHAFTQFVHLQIDKHIHKQIYYIHAYETCVCVCMYTYTNMQTRESNCYMSVCLLIRMYVCIIIHPDILMYRRCTHGFAPKWGYATRPGPHSCCLPRSHTVLVCITWQFLRQPPFQRWYQSMLRRPGPQSKSFLTWKF